MTISIFAKLRDKVALYFNEEELKNLCFDLDISSENLAGLTHEAKSRELIQYCFRHGKLNVLVARLKELRSHLSWEFFEATLGESSTLTKPNANREVSFSFLQQWKPNSMPNGFGADILLKSDFQKEEIIAFIEFLTTEFISYANTKDAPVLIRLWSSKIAYDQDQERNFGDAFRQGYLAFYVRNLTGKGAYSGFNEIRWMQAEGKLDHLFGTVTKL